MLDRWKKISRGRMLWQVIMNCISLVTRKQMNVDRFWLSHMLLIFCIGYLVTAIGNAVAKFVDRILYWN